MTRPQPRKVTRLFAAPLGAVLALGLTACAPIMTQKQYAPSDGVRVVVSDDVIVENLMIVGSAQGEPGSLQGAIRNDGGGTNVSIGSEMFAVDAGETLLLGGDSGREAVINSVPVAPGSTFDIQVSAGGSQAQDVPVPVLDGTTGEYAAYLPEQDASASCSAGFARPGSSAPLWPGSEARRSAEAA